MILFKSKAELDTLKSYTFTFLGHFVLLAILFALAYVTGIIKYFPSNETVMRWDANWYRSIVENGYSFNPGKQSNVAFFPLFPLLWQFTQLSPIGICLLNLLLLWIGVYILKITFELQRKYVLLLLALPSIFFCFLPYSEAIFFLATAVTLYGLKRNYTLAVIGIFISCLSRSVSLLFIPMILFSHLLNLTPKGNNKKLVLQTLGLLGSAIVATLLAQYIQYLGSGYWFTLFEVQKAWDRSLKIPKLVFTTWGGAKLLWLDGLAFLIGVIATISCLRYCWKKWSNWNLSISKPVLFSLGYFVLITAVNLFFSGTKAGDNTSIYSLNRYVFATAFMAVPLSYLQSKDLATKDTLIKMGIICGLTWCLFGLIGGIPEYANSALGYSATLIYFTAVTILAMLYVLQTNIRLSKFVFPLLYLFTLILQLHLIKTFLKGGWVS